MPPEDALTVSTADRLDTTYALVKGVPGAIPIAGSPIAEVIGRFVAPPLARKQERLIADIIQRLQRLSDGKAVTPGEILGSESFHAALLTGIQSASRTASEAKIRALRNAIVNAALGYSDAYSGWEIFLAKADRLTSPYLVLLAAVCRIQRFRLADEKQWLIKANIPEISCNGPRSFPPSGSHCDRRSVEVFPLSQMIRWNGPERSRACQQARRERTLDGEARSVE